MTPERWLRVKEIYYVACDLASAERRAFLANACDGDLDLRREVESLLAEDGSRAGMLDGVTVTIPVVVAATGSGAQLGPYRIDVSIGKGGMGEVWRARDTRLNRDVAIKISAHQFSDRFEREARAIAALNHPNICTIHDIGPNYLVMELIEGPTLAERIRRGRIPTEEALAIAKQIANALEAAHEKGVVHRDLKPANIKIRPDGSVKVLDFGIAKAGGEEGAVDATLTVTTPGMIMGTPGYMPPEQARGEKVDKRADIWAFGVVLYEMVAGKRPFEGQSVSDTLAAVISLEPDWERAPVKVQKLLRACLEKDPKRRLRDVGDMERLLDTEAVTDAPSRSRLSLAGLIAAGLLALVAAAVAFVRPAPADLSAYKFTPIARNEVTQRSPAWSPDGKSVAYAADIHGIYQVFTKTLGAPDAAQLTHETKNCVLPFWSPDGATIYYNSDRDLWAVAASGGAPKLVMEKADSPALHPDGKTLVFGRDGKTWVGSLKGTTSGELELTPPGTNALRQFSPNGSALVFTAGGQLWIVPWPSGAPRNLGAAGKYGAQWFPDSRHLIMGGADADNTLSVIDTVDGSRRVIYRGTDSFMASSVSPDGRKIAYSGGASEWDVLEVSVPEARVHTVVAQSYDADWAPSGTHFLLTTAIGGNQVIEDRSAAEGFSRLVADAPQGGSGTIALVPRWAPDGARFLFVQGVPGRTQLTVSNASGGSWTPLGAALAGGTWSPDGQWIAFLRIEGSRQQLVKMRPAAGSTPLVLANVPPGDAGNTIQWSPTGDAIAFRSAEGISMISPDGNTLRKLTDRKLLVYAFSKDGAQIFGIVRNTTGEGAQWQLYSIDVKTGVDKMLAPIDLPASTSIIRGFSLHPDGKRFLTSIAKFPFDIWMLEGWDQPTQKSWLDRLLRR